MNRLLKTDELVALYHLPQHVREQLVATVKSVEKVQEGEPLFLEAQVDAWLTQRYAALPLSRPDGEFMTTREVARLLRCSYSEARERLLDDRIKAIRDGRWLRTCRAWVDEYIATKTIKPVDQDVVPLPVPKRKRHIDSGIKVTKGGIAWRFLQERAK